MGNGIDRVPAWPARPSVPSAHPAARRDAFGARCVRHRQETAAVIAAAAEQLAASNAEPSAGVSLACYGARWLEQRDRDGKRNAANEHWCWNKHIASEHFAIGPLSDITKRDARCSRLIITRTLLGDARTSPWLIGFCPAAA
jgi:hypothetical protein